MEQGISSAPSKARQWAYCEWRIMIRAAHTLRIKMHPPWRERFEHFLHDMGEPPNGTKLNRYDKSRDFTPENVYWG